MRTLTLSEYLFLLQALLNGPHTKVRVDTAFSPEKHGKPGKGAQQTGLSKFYKGALINPAPGIFASILYANQWLSVVGPLALK